MAASKEPGKSSNRKTLHTGQGLVFGAGLGIVFGAAFGNPGVGLVFGAAIGLVLGAGFAALRSQNNR
jgi:hypothetical protein